MTEAKEPSGSHSFACVNPSTGVAKKLACRELIVQDHCLDADRASSANEEYEYQERHQLKRMRLENLSDTESIGDNVVKSIKSVPEDLPEDGLSVKKFPKNANHPAQTLKCRHCTVQFPSYKELYSHFKVHHDELPCRCPFCQYATDEPSYLKQHLKSHKDERRYQCDQCHASFKFRSRLNRHKLSHTNEAKKYSCTDCDMRFTQQKSADEHWMRFHSGKGKQCYCNICDKPIGRPSFMAVHMRRQHSAADGPYMCGKCPARCETRYELRIHLKTIHSKQTLRLKQLPFYICPLCYRGPEQSDRGIRYFEAVDNVKKHIRTFHLSTHSMKPRWPMFKAIALPDKLLPTMMPAVADCLICNMPFSNLASIDSHDESHLVDITDSSKKLWRCNLCLRTMLTSSQAEHDSAAHLDAHLLDVHKFCRKTMIDHMRVMPVAQSQTVQLSVATDRDVTDEVFGSKVDVEVSLDVGRDTAIKEEYSWQEDLKGGFGFFDDDD